MAVVRVQAEDFDPGTALAALQHAAPGCGAIASFVGVVRSNAARPLRAMTLEHYPAMTQAALARIAEQAEQRFAPAACMIIHRHGTLSPGERIVFAGAAAAHRRPALEATEFLIDWLKTKAPFWKKETFADGLESWVAALDEDEAAAQRWGG